MKFDPGQRKVYIIAIAVIVAAIAILCIWFLYLKDGDEKTPAAVDETPMPSHEISVSPVSAQHTSEQQVSTVGYYQDNYGYLVPVMCEVPYEDGIAKATLNRMVKSAANDMQAARLGLRTVIPEGVEMELDIAEGRARIDMKYEGELEFADLSKVVWKEIQTAVLCGCALALLCFGNMITAIVQTLTEFDSVESVEFLFNGQQKEFLPNGTDVSGKFTRGDINPETESLPTSASAKVNPLTLYFPGESSSVVVPVTRLVYSDADINTAVLEMTRGPMSDALTEAIPDGCGLIGVEVENGVAKINFTKEFMQIVNDIDGGRLALKALTVTCTQFDNVESVEIYVEGEKWDTGEGTLATPTFANIAGDIEYDYIQTQANAIFESE